MDIKDVSHTDYYVALLRNAQNAADRAARRKGQKVRDHPAPRQLVLRFLMNLQASTAQFESQEITIAMSQVPAPYTPCARPTRELRPLMISDMKLETHHRGSLALLRFLTPPQRMTAVMAIVEDEQSTAVLLQLYHQPENSVVPTQEILQRGGVCIIKEPFFKCATDGAYTLRVDHVSDIIWLEDFDDRVPSKWRVPALTLSNGSKGVREQGNEAVKHQNWADAERLYSSAIRTAKTPEEEQLAHLNRSLANLRLRRPEKAMADATRGSDAALPPSEKRLFREARALYELGQFEACLEKLQVLLASYPENTDAKRDLERAKARLHERKTGDYDFRRMYKQAEPTPPLVDCATFSAPVEVRESPGRGRGLFTTAPISAGQLLLCEKAFAYSYAAEDEEGVRCLSVLMNMSTKKVTMGGQAHLLTQIVQKLYHGHTQSREFRELYCGDYTTPRVSETDGIPVVDSFGVEKIISLNGFGAPRTTRASFIDSVSEATNTKTGHSHTTCGIWLLGSRINHSCISNCRRSFIGDMLIVRATTDLLAGTEILFPYRRPEPLESYEEQKKNLNHWGFSCECELCTERKATPKDRLEERKSLHRTLSRVLNSSGSTNTSKVLRLLERMEKTHPATNANAVRLELWDPYFALGAHLLSTGKLADAVKIIVKGFEALGYSITACPPIGKLKRPRLEVKRWGMANHFAPWAFNKLSEAYGGLAPELCAPAKQYAQIAYSMVVGERESIGDVFPELLRGRLFEIPRA